MKRLGLWALTAVWLAGGLMMIGFIGAADRGAPLIPCYIAAAGSGLASFAALFAAQGIAVAEGWLDLDDATAEPKGPQEKSRPMKSGHEGGRMPDRLTGRKDI